MIRVVIVGAAGRMGRELLRACHEGTDLTCSGATDRPGSPLLGHDLGALLDRPPVGVRLQAGLAPLLAGTDVVIDFTAPEATLDHAAACAAAARPIVIGTTGLNTDQLATLRGYSQQIPIVYSTNFSVGVNLLWALAAQTARIWKDLGPMTIAETHHVHKKDSPSGTAKTLAERTAQAAGWSRDAIPIHAERHGEVVGDHTLTCDSPGETLTLTHHAKSRAIFARGALHAAHWLPSQPKGWYGMSDVLGLE